MTNPRTGEPMKKRAMKRWTVSLEVECDDVEVEASSEAEANRKASEMVENSGYGLFVVGAIATEIRYDRPPGTDRWASVADEIRFAEDGHKWVAGDGCWWWTNGHVALRCDGAPPTNDWRVRQSDTIADVVGDHKRDRIEWQDPNARDLRVATKDKRVQAKDDYVRLVECGYDDVEWYAVEGDHDEPWMVPITAIAGGELVAVVMGVRP